MARIAGVDLPKKKRMEYALTYIYGIGLTTSRKILDATGISYDKRVHELSEEEAAAIRKEIQENYMVEGDLRKKVAMDIKALMDLGNYRGDPYGNIEKAAPYAVGTHAKTDVYVEGQGRQDADFRRITQILAKAGYKGCLSIEYEGQEEPMTAMPKFVNYLKECAAEI